MNRHERRKRASEERRATNRPDQPSVPAIASHTAAPAPDPLATDTASKPRGPSSESDAIGAAATAAAAMEDTLSAVWRNSVVQPACKRGCSYCCTVRVSVTIPEVIRLVAHARQTLTGEELARVEARARDNARRTHGTTDRGYPPRLDCAFLGDDRSCLVHSARPLVCQREHSVNATQCKMGYELQEIGTDYPIDRLVPAKLASDVVVEALRDTLTEAGLDPGTYELQEAAHIAFSDANAVAGWLAGRPTFARAQVNLAADAWPTAMPVGARRPLPKHGGELRKPK